LDRPLVHAETDSPARGSESHPTQTRGGKSETPAWADVTELNTMLNKFFQLQTMMKKMGKMAKMKARMGGGPPGMLRR